MKNIYLPFILLGLLFSFNLEGKVNYINNSVFYHDEVQTWVVDDYYQYMVELIKKVLHNNSALKVNVVFGNGNYHFGNRNKNIRINFDFEHTLVTRNGGGVPRGCPFGNVLTANDDYYYVRIDRLDELKLADIVIEYSIPNIHNITTSNKFRNFAKKLIYVAPLIYDTYFLDKEGRSNEVLTTFVSTHQPRRKLLLDNIQKQGINHKNVNNCVGKNELQKLYRKTKILINIHQTEHHHTFEELRVLPALLCGVLVVCEDSPLKHLIPYHEYIIWSSYDTILEKVIDVANNYEFYHKKIFGEKGNGLFQQLHKSNLDNIENALIKQISKIRTIKPNRKRSYFSSSQDSCCIDHD